MLKQLKQITVGKRIVVLCVFLLVLMVVISVFSLIEIHKLEKEIEVIAEEDIPLMRVVAIMTERQLDQATRYGEILQYGHAKVQDKFEEAIEEFEDAGHAFVEMIVEGRNLAALGIKTAENETIKKEFQQINALLEKIEKEHADYEHHSELTFQRIALEAFGESATHAGGADAHGQEGSSGDSSMHQKDDVESIIKAIELMEEETKHLEERFEELLEIIEHMTKEMLDSAIQVQKLAFEVLIPLTVIAVVGGLFLATFIASSIIMALKDTTGDISLGAEQLSAAARQLAAASEDIASTTAEQAQAVESTLTYIHDVDKLATDSKEKAKQSSSYMKRVHEMISKTGADLTKTAESSGSLRNRVKKCGHLIGVLNDLVVQLDLLAVNASAEATRDEATKGFAVFTKKMSENAQQAKLTVRKAMDLLATSDDEMTQMHEVSESSQKEFKKVIEVMAHVKSLMAKITDSSVKQAKQLAEVTSNFGAINDSIQHNAANSEETAAAGEELNAQAESMLEIVDGLVEMIEGRKKRVTED